jgi:hypothetical protein
MERRDFLKFSFGFAAMAGTLVAAATAAQAAPLLPATGLVPEGDLNAASDGLRAAEGAEHAVVTQEEVDAMNPETVQWRRRRRVYYIRPRRRVYFVRPRRRRRVFYY